MSTSKKGLLLRLFESEHFDPYIALSYLFKYEDPGIQEYLCVRLKEFPPEAIEFLLPQLVHLFICKPEESASLENFMLEESGRSSHFAIMLLWLLEGYLNNLKTTTQPYAVFVCSRLYSKCHAMIFTTRANIDGKAPFMYPYHRVRVSAQIKPALLGMSYALAAFAAPDLLEPLKRMALIHGRQNFPNFKQEKPTVIQPQKSKSEESVNQTQSLKKSPTVTVPIHEALKKTPSIDQISTGNIFTFENYLENKPNTLMPTSPEVVSPIDQHTGEMQFINMLIDISIRLVPVSKSVRPQTLQAELTLLNHNLPADVCLPFWCNSKLNKSHHKLVRVPTTESVTLNSAERVPYMILLEVLEDETDSIETLAFEKERYMELHGTNSPIPTATITRVGSKNSVWNQTTRAKSSLSEVYSSNSSSKNSIDEAQLEVNIVNHESILNRKNSTQMTNINEHMKAAAIMLAQIDMNQQSNNTFDVKEADKIRQKIVSEMNMLEEQRLAQGLTDVEIDAMIENPELAKEDPSAVVFKESWEAKVERVRKKSPFGHRPNWKLLSVIVKSGADLRQEQLACQLIHEIQKIWNDANVPCWLYYFRVMAISNDSGLIETVLNTISVHSIKKDAYVSRYNSPGVPYTLYDHFIKTYGEPTSKSFLDAQNSFMESLAGYSLITYLLQLKDRHNGNILVDKKGHIVHIDFGFMLSNSPGSVGFESAPFKLLQEYVDILGGINSPKFMQFKQAMVSGLLSLRPHADKLILLLVIMQKNSFMPCFQSGESCIQAFRDRLHCNLSEEDLAVTVDKLITRSYGSVYTRLYDTFQYYSNGIL
ncbi:Phosphatidylinositol 4-kinase domain-containing protein [Rozella allomycis CSF55]|uniref:1-phosphatidylinositol 4-kinase n=1 Tax=Rozella allomycis (strain CSF55) TaxID=988480 RepID=A0A075ARJ1_ROZAC|nr:Phosphatidylinositol 4-kinase domain-containing protein [Rozella allomycis CSF55]|eukprot:EPZ32863.1 Phosphatidylinositol 4-kinase domain-containing protein [Rozella allomycis CSF55]